MTNEKTKPKREMVTKRKTSQLACNDLLSGLDSHVCDNTEKYVNLSFDRPEFQRFRDSLVAMVRELDAWRALAHCQLLAVSAVAKDANYECQCGTEPYTDGDPCPCCFARLALRQFNDTRDAWKLELTR